jgi:Novel STAND NTPase 3/Restriction endonuclease
MNSTKPQAQGRIIDLALHTLGWKAFQDLCAQICEEVLQQPVAIYREAQDGGQDAVFLFKKSKKTTGTGTVQCKFTSDHRRRLKLTDLRGEINNVKELVAKGEADTYYFITNMGVDAPVAADIRKELIPLGVTNPQIFGREWISQKIRESSRLRALVPRVYGLGDLSTILDERRADQTRALLGHLIPALRVYVPTAAHRQAVRILKENGIVLLLGAPATGKSMLASILATSALDDGHHRCFQVDSPQELLNQWNPNELGGFYWIDDAFGPNQLREDYVDQWISIMNKLKTAISGGNRFVLTSRSHIWNAAKRKLATRNHPLLANNAAVVDVGSLGPEERRQILYNHIKAGNQPRVWKTKIKPFLDMLSEDTNLLPEIARRLGDSNYTGGINSFADDLNRFVSEPMEFLKETLEELSEAQRAALTLVFMYRSRLPTIISDSKHCPIVCDKYCVSQIDIGSALEQLDGTFVVKKSNEGVESWGFRHPTIADALSSLLGDRPDLTDLYLRGAKIEAIMSDAVCADRGPIRDAIVIR